jgi:acyltransferase
MSSILFDKFLIIKYLFFNYFTKEKIIKNYFVSLDKDGRNSIVDNVRGIGIIFVVIGHAPGISSVFHGFIFSFHVPLFFFLSGFSFKEIVHLDSFFIYIKKLSKSLLVPFSFFWLISYLYWLPTHLAGGNSVLYKNYTVFTPILGFFKATSDAMPMNPALWFFTALFFISLIYWMLRFFINNKYILIVFSFFISIISVLYFDKIRQLSYWNINISLVCIVFYALGNFFKNSINNFDKKIVNRKLLSSIAALLFLCLFFLSNINYSVDISKGVFGINCYLFYFNSFIGFVGVIIIAKIISRNKLLTYLSRNSLILFSFHMISFRVLTAILVLVFGFARQDLSSIYFAFIYVAWALTLLIPVVYFLRKKFPVILGGRK